MTGGVDIDGVAGLIAAAAAEEILPRHTRLAAGDVREKGPGDLVTVADEAVERRLTRQLTELLPGSLVVGEEAAAADPSLLRRLADPGSVWVVDPLDGTSNFAAGGNDFAVMVALIHGGRTVAGWIHDPLGRRMASAEAGAGAWLDGRRLSVAPAPTDPAALTGTLLVGFYGDPELGRQVHRRRDRVRPVKSRRCAAVEYLALATGAMHFALFSRLMPWDHAAGVLIHGEAGGYNGYLDGGGYEPARLSAKGLLLAPDAASWQALYERLIAS